MNKVLKYFLENTKGATFGAIALKITAYEEVIGFFNEWVGI